MRRTPQICLIQNPYHPWDEDVYVPTLNGCFVLWFSLVGDIIPSSVPWRNVRSNLNQAGETNPLSWLLPALRGEILLSQMSCLEDHPSGCNCLGSPPFISHEKAICKGNVAPVRGLTITMVINHLQVLGWSSKWEMSNVGFTWNWAKRWWGETMKDQCQLIVLLLVFRWLVTSNLPQSSKNNSGTYNGGILTYVSCM